jgi:ABC-type uncharacterized transport system permease subunit
MKKKNEMSFIRRMFMDDNDINEKSIVGFVAFIMMVICLAVDIWTGFHGQEMPINEFIFDGFMVITLGSFGIASVDKFITAKHGDEKKEEETYD